MSTCAGRRDYLNIYFWYFSPCAPNGCSSPPFLNNPSLFWRCLCHRHVFLTHLNMIYPPFMYFLWDRLPRLIECTPQLSVCVSALGNERGIRWLFFPYSSPCAITVLIMWLTVKTSRVHPLC